MPVAEIVRETPTVDKETIEVEVAKLTVLEIGEEDEKNILNYRRWNLLFAHLVLFLWLPGQTAISIILLVLNTSKDPEMYNGLLWLGIEGMILVTLASIQAIVTILFHKHSP